jgi:hypothetical protein
VSVDISSKNQNTPPSPKSSPILRTNIFVAKPDFKPIAEHPAPRNSTKHFPEMRICPVSSLLEIAQAADLLPIEQKRKLIAFLLTRLHAANDELPPVRDIPKKTLEAWVADDEKGFRKFLARS